MSLCISWIPLNSFVKLRIWLHWLTFLFAFSFHKIWSEPETWLKRCFHWGPRIIILPWMEYKSVLSREPMYRVCVCVCVCISYWFIYVNIWFELVDGASSKGPACQCRRFKRCGFKPWVGKIPQSRKWQPTPVFLPGDSHGQRSLKGYSLWSHRGWIWLRD